MERSQKKKLKLYFDTLQNTLINLLITGLFLLFLFVKYKIYENSKISAVTKDQ